MSLIGVSANFTGMEISNQFLDIVTISDRMADTIVTAVKAVLQNKQWAWH